MSDAPNLDLFSQWVNETHLNDEGHWDEIKAYIAALEQERDCYKVWQKPHDPDDCPLCESLRTIRGLREAIRRIQDKTEGENDGR